MNAQLSRRRAAIESDRKDLDSQLVVTPPDRPEVLSLTEDGWLRADWESRGEPCSFETIAVVQLSN